MACSYRVIESNLMEGLVLKVRMIKGIQQGTHQQNDEKADSRTKKDFCRNRGLGHVSLGEGGSPCQSEVWYGESWEK